MAPRDWMRMAPGRDRTIDLTGREVLQVLEALAGMSARSGDPEEVTACMRLAQRLEGLGSDRPAQAPPPALQPGQVRVTCEDDQGPPQVATITNDYILICAGNRYLDTAQKYRNGTAVLTVKATS